MRNCTLVVLLAAGLTQCSRADAQTQGGLVVAPRNGTLQPPGHGPIPVAFVISEGATVIDFAGPWEVFDNVMVPERGSAHEAQMPFRLYTVSDSREPIRGSGGLRIVPDYTFDDAPFPRVVVIGAQAGKSPKMVDWMRRMTERGDVDVVMSVCTGAFKLALTGALDGKPATTHHEFYDAFQKAFPRVQVVRGRRFVRSDQRIFTAGGLTSGMDLALHVVNLYFGRGVSEKTASYLEYEGTGWKRADG
jgi:transcriptional regulator GlxA family with amidase domain